MFRGPRQALCSGFIAVVPLKTDILCRRKQWESILNESKWLKRGAESYCRAVGVKGRSRISTLVKDSERKYVWGLGLGWKTVQNHAYLRCPVSWASFLVT